MIMEGIIWFITMVIFIIIIMVLLVETIIASINEWGKR